MKKITCELCESTDILKQEGFYVCQSCGTKYTVDEAKKMMVDVGETIQEEKTSKVVNTSKLDNLYVVARRAKDDANVDQAFKYYEHIMLETPNCWEATFYVAFFSAMQKNKKGEINTPIRLIDNCIDVTFDLIENIQYENEQAVAVTEISGSIDLIIGILEKRIKEDYDEKRTKEKTAADSELELVTNLFVSKGKKERNERRQWISEIKEKVSYRIEKISKALSESRFNEYWDAHRSEKNSLEKEKQSLTEQISDLHKEISEIPVKTYGYSRMLELQKKIKNLNAEKQSLDFFKFNEKRVIQDYIGKVNTEIASIQSRINSAIEVTQQCISSLQCKIDNIDNELSKPR